jgi:hypothetical protein
MNLRLMICIAAFAVSAGVVAAPPASAVPTHVAAHTKRQAEQNVLRIAARSWNHARIPDLIDPRTQLLRNNVRAICSGRGAQVGKHGYRRFLCVLHPWPARGRQELYVTYRVLPDGGFRAHWLRIRRL